MSDRGGYKWGELEIFGVVAIIVALRYLYEVKCAPRPLQEGPLDEEEAEAQLRNSAAEARLLKQLDEATRVRFFIVLLRYSAA